MFLALLASAVGSTWATVGSCIERPWLQGIVTVGTVGLVPNLSSIRDPRSSILDHPSSILDPRFSILDSRSSILDSRFSSSGVEKPKVSQTQSSSFTPGTLSEILSQIYLAKVSCMSSRGTVPIKFCSSPLWLRCFDCSLDPFRGAPWPLVKCCVASMQESARA